MASSGKQWQCQLFSPSERLAYLRNSGHLSDLIITFPGHSTVLQAHRLLLAMSSPVFEAMLYGPLAGDDTLALPEDPPEAFEWLLNHLYMNETQLPDLTLAAKVYLLASKYQLDNVCKICSEVMVKYTTAENFPNMFEFATLMEDQPLFNKCEAVLANETDEVLKSPRVGALGRRALALMLTHEKLFASTEVLVFDALIRWGRAQLAKTRKEAAEADGASSKEEDAQEKRSRSKNKESNTLRNVVKEFLLHIRFLTLSTDDFVKHVIPSHVFTSDEAIYVLMNIKSLQNVHLPPIASCTSREQRIKAKPNNRAYHYKYSIGGKRYFEATPKYGGFTRPTNVEVGDFPELNYEDDEM